MSLGGSSSNFSPPPQRTLGVDPSRASTNQQARPLTWFTGMQRIGITWLGQAFNVKAIPIKEEAGKKEIQIGNDYHIGCAGLLCGGPVDLVHQIYFDDQLVWEGELWRSGDNVSITIEGYGVLRFYFGTETQSIDASLAALAIENGDNPIELHPAYRGQAYFVCDSLYLGANRTSAPQIEFVLGRFPKPPWMTRESNLRGDINPVASVWDLLGSNLLGLGLGSKLHEASWDTSATRLDDECFGLSPILTEEVRFGKFLLQISEAVDGFPIPKPDGTLGFGLRRSESTEGLVHIDETDCLDVPRLSSQSWAQAINETRLTFTNREIGWKEDLATSFDLASRAVDQEPRSQSLQRPWITRPIVAAGVAPIATEEGSIPSIEGSVQIKRSSLGELDLGSLFLLSYPHAGICRWPARVTRLIWPSPSAPEVNLNFRIERIAQSGLFSKPVHDKAPEQVEYIPKAAEHYRIIEVPRLPLNDPRPAFIALVERPGFLSTGAHVHQLIDGSYEWIHTLSDFAQHGTLDSAFTAGELIDEDGFTVTLLGPDTVLSVGSIDSALALRKVALIGNEVLAPYEASLIGENQYHMKAIRARLGTELLNHGSGQEVWFFSLASNAAWPVESEDPNQTFKIQPFIKPSREPVELGACPAIESDYTQKWLRPYPPVNLEVNGASESASYSSGGDILITWSLIDEFDLGILNRWKESTDSKPVGVIRVCDEFGTVVLEHIGSPGEEAWALGNGSLVGAFGAEPGTFKIRGFQRLGSLDSESFVEITVNQL